MSTPRNFFGLNKTSYRAAVAQLDRVPGFEPGCREFKSLRPHQFFLGTNLDMDAEAARLLTGTERQLFFSNEIVVDTSISGQSECIC